MTDEGIEKRVSRLERKLDNGVFVARELYYENRKNRDKEVDEIKDTQKWLMRGIIISFGTILLHFVLTVISTLVLSGVVL